MKKTILCILLITAFFVKAEVYQQQDDGEYMLYTNSVDETIQAMYMLMQGWGVPVIGHMPSLYTYGSGVSEDLASQYENQLNNVILRKSHTVGAGRSSFEYDIRIPGQDTRSYINYRNWILDYFFRLQHGIYTNSLQSVDDTAQIQWLLGVIDSRLEQLNNKTNSAALPSADWKTWHNDNLAQSGGWFGLAPTVSQLPVQDMLARMGWERQFKDNIDSLAEFGLTVPELEDLFGQGWQGGAEAGPDGIPQKLLDKASKSLKFHVSMKAKTNALHAVLGFKGTNTLEDAVKKVVEEIKGVREGVSNIAEAGGLGGSGTNEFCCYFGLAWSNFQERTAIKLPPGVTSWDEFLRGWQQDMTQITESGDVRLRQWWGMMYTQTLLLDRQKREITGFGGMITRASNQTNAVDEIAEKVQEDLQQADKWQEDLEGDIGRLYVSNVAPRVLEPMENFAKGLKGPEKRRLLKAAGNDEVVLLEWTGLGIRIAFDKSQMEDVADKVRAFIRAFLYLLDAVIILYIGICAFRLVGRAYEFAHSCV